MGISGSQKFAVLLCKFKDSPDVEPQSADFCRDLIVSRGTGGLNDYWVDASLGSINLDGTEVFGWKVIDKTHDDFLKAYPGRWDKILGAIAAFPDLRVSDYAGFIAVFNVMVGDGGNQNNGVLAQPIDLNLTFLGHETGHVFGLDHSFDTSDRIVDVGYPQGEYWDFYDIMSAMNVSSSDKSRFSPVGPLLNVANLDYMGWLPSARVWQPGSTNSSNDYVFDIVSLGHPEIPGYVAAHIGGIYVEFRTPEKWDEGLGRPAVLIHKMVGVNSVILPSDERIWNNEWQPGQMFGPSAVEMAAYGGTQIFIDSFDLQAKTARIRVRRRAVNPFVAGPGRTSIGVGAGAGGWIVLPSGRRVPVPPHSPLINILSKLALVAEAEETLGPVASTVVAHAVYGDLVQTLYGVMQAGRERRE